MSLLVRLFLERCVTSTARVFYTLCVLFLVLRFLGLGTRSSPKRKPGTIDSKSNCRLSRKEIIFPLLAGVRPQDFPEPRLEAPQAEQALPPPDFPPELDPPVLPREEVSPQPIAEGADGMDIDAGEVGEGPEPMTIDKVDEVSEGEGSEEEEGDAWLNNLILQTQADVWNTF